MKKRFGLGRVVPPASIGELEAMPTKHLLGRLERLRHCPQSLAQSDFDPQEVTTVDGVLFKDSARWKDAFAEVKAVLTSREHVAGAAERRERRRERATKNASSERRTRR